jgi:type II secretory pathway pseudopilin PulG
MRRSRHFERNRPFRPVGSGFTLIELSVMILVMLTFISVLFIGSRAWKRGSDRAQCVMNIRNVQLAVRGYANSNDLDSGDYLTLLGSNGPPGRAIIGSGNYLETFPMCPGMGLYTIHGNTVPATGTLYMTCSLSGSERHEPDMYGSW